MHAILLIYEARASKPQFHYFDRDMVSRAPASATD